MNEYRITYLTSDQETGTDSIIERNEAAARKSFKGSYIGGKFIITDVELLRTGLQATKQQERDTLAAIRLMIDELGPQSYIGTALEGCLEIAEQNIDNDFGDSMKQRAESAEQQAIELKRELADSRREFENSLSATRSTIEQKNDEIVALKAEIAAIQQPVDPSEISDEFVADLAVFSAPYIEGIRAALIQNAGQIFKNKTIVGLLREYVIREEQERLEYARWLKDSIKNGDNCPQFNNCLTHASSYHVVLEDLFRPYWQKGGNQP